MATVGDILRITSCGNLFDQQVCNVFYYLVSVWTGNADFQDVVDVFETVILDQIAVNTVDDYVVNEVKVENLDDPAEQTTAVVNVPGDLTDTPLPSYVAATIKLVRTTAATRHGSKRIAGIGETYVVDNNISPSNFMSDVATVLAAELDFGSDFTLDPVIVGRNTDGTLNLAVINPVSDAEVSQFISTQNSRKPGHGS